MNNDITKLTGLAEAEASFPNLLGLAANDDTDEGEQDVSLPNNVAAVPWYTPSNKDSNQVLVPKTPGAMAYEFFDSNGSLTVVFSYNTTYNNMRLDSSKTTDIHNAASSGVANDDPNILDSNDDQVIDVTDVPPKQITMRTSVESLLMPNAGLEQFSSENTSNMSSPENESPSSFSDSTSSELAVIATENKEYPIDPSLPDIKKNTIYSTDE